MAIQFQQDQQHDFIIVGSGAGGGPLAANLALAGFSVLLIEAGEDDINDNYEIPALHPRSTEDPKFSWEFFVKHYDDDNQPERDPKYHKQGLFPGSPGIFYPRATGLGGCTIHHAMITVYPHESDWNHIYKLVGDDSWNAENMRKYFDERIANPQYENGSKLLKLLEKPDPTAIVSGWLKKASHAVKGENATKKGWLSISQADPKLLAGDIHGIFKVVVAAFKTAKHKPYSLKAMPQLNPNHLDVAEKNLEGINVIPISVHQGKRVGSRERIVSARKKLQKQADQGHKTGRLDIATNTLATRVVFDDDNRKRIIGVECLTGKALYHARHHEVPPGIVKKTILYTAQKEVILCGGAFNTPQLLMLSGIGPAEELQRPEINIKVCIDSPKVGTNLQDRYEVGVVARAAKPFKLLDGAEFRGSAKPDKHYNIWKNNKGEGLYGTNGSVLGIIKRSSTQAKSDPPDLYIFGVPGFFRGYEIGYSDKAYAKDHFTWAVLKGHTNNRSGYVKLRSKDPLDPPEIHFKYFEESGLTESEKEEDIQSVIDGVEFVQKINERLVKEGIISEIVAPKPGDDLKKFVTDNAWGHHASCTCAIGPEENDVLDKDFLVRGTENLRVVDASVFPRIPGLFILSSVYMISEKASDVIIDKYNS
jgi:choline dehydrogenase